MSNKVRSLARARERSGMLKAKIRELLESRPALQSLIGQPLPATVAFKLAQLVRALNPSLEAYEATRKKLCEQHGTLDEETQIYQFGKNQEAFEKQIGELLDSEVDIAGEKIRVDFLSQAQLSAGEMLTLQWLITE